MDSLKLRVVGQGATRRELLFTDGFNGAVGHTTLAFDARWDSGRKMYRFVKVLDDRSRGLMWNEGDPTRAYGVGEWEWLPPKKDAEGKSRTYGVPGKYRIYRWTGTTFVVVGDGSGWPPR